MGKIAREEGSDGVLKCGPIPRRQLGIPVLQNEGFSRFLYERKDSDRDFVLDRLQEVLSKATNTDHLP